ARTSLERGDLERAETTYRSLLLILRHSSSGGSAAPNRAEGDVELGEPAARRGEADRARGPLAPPTESALGSDRERAGLEQALRRRAKRDVLLGALEMQLERAPNATSAARALAALVVFHVENASLTEARAGQLVERAVQVRRELGTIPTVAELDAFR